MRANCLVSLTSVPMIFFHFSLWATTGIILLNKKQRQKDRLFVCFKIIGYNKVIDYTVNSFTPANNDLQCSLPVDDGVSGKSFIWLEKDPHSVFLLYFSSPHPFLFSRWLLLCRILLPDFPVSHSS